MVRFLTVYRLFNYETAAAIDFPIPAPAPSSGAAGCANVCGLGEWSGTCSWFRWPFTSNVVTFASQSLCLHVNVKNNILQRCAQTLPLGYDKRLRLILRLLGAPVMGRRLAHNTGVLPETRLSGPHGANSQPPLPWHTSHTAPPDAVDTFEIETRSVRASFGHSKKHNTTFWNCSAANGKCWFKRFSLQSPYWFRRLQLRAPASVRQTVPGF
jgi:hypothetical protein